MTLSSAMVSASQNDQQLTKHTGHKNIVIYLPLAAFCIFFKTNKCTKCSKEMTRASGAKSYDQRNDETTPTTKQKRNESHGTREPHSKHTSNYQQLLTSRRRSALILHIRTVLELDEKDKTSSNDSSS